LRALVASGEADDGGKAPAAAASVPGGAGHAGQEGAIGPAEAPAHAAPEPPAAAVQGSPEPTSREEAERHLVAGQGYYELAMYREAAASFRRAVALYPDSLAARMFLAMSHMHLREWEDAEREFLFIVRTAPQPKLKALGLNALGCIQAVTANLELAARYFRQACEADPGFTEAARNLANCSLSAGPLTLHFGDSGFGCT
jgi:tetratricopeptide (TPR) repeat protein